MTNEGEDSTEATEAFWDRYLWRDAPNSRISLDGMPLTAVVALLCDGRGMHESNYVGAVFGFGDPDAENPTSLWELQPPEGKGQGTRILIDGKQIPRVEERAYFAGENALGEHEGNRRMSYQFKCHLCPLDVRISDPVNFQALAMYVQNTAPASTETDFPRWNAPVRILEIQNRRRQVT